MTTISHEAHELAERDFNRLIGSMPRQDFEIILAYTNVLNDRIAAQSLLLSDKEGEIAALREALEVPSVWSDEERDGMSNAYSNAAGKHGHYERMFAVGAWLLRHRQERAKS